MAATPAETIAVTFILIESVSEILLASCDWDDANTSTLREQRWKGYGSLREGKEG